MGGLVRLRRKNTGIPWGFRLNGGLEYGVPLYIQKVNPGSLAQRAGLMPGDAVLQINSLPTAGIEHERAKLEIIRAGNEVDFIVQRNVMAVGPPGSSCGTGPNHPRAEQIDMPPVWKALPPQDPNVQSRTFKVLQKQYD